MHAMTVRAPGPWVKLPWFLTTPPAVGLGHVVRERLSAELDAAAADFPLTLVVAPPGYGKTTAVAHWVEGRRSSVWVTAVEGVDTLQVIRGALLEAVPSEGRPRLPDLAAVDSAPTPAVLLGMLAGETTIVIDEAHLLEPSVLASTLCSDPILRSGLIRLVLVGRPELARTNARAVAAGLAGIVNAQTLAFTTEETATLLHLSGKQPGAANVVTERTGGWAVAVRLHATLDGDDATQVLDPHMSVSTSESLLSDYLEHSLLGSLPTDVAEFVLDATVVSRVDVALARDLTGRDDVALLLDRCVSAGLLLDRFTDPDRGVVYRWHETFRTAAQEILERRDQLRLLRLHNLAARSLAPRFPTEAVFHALRAHDPGLGMDIIRSSWLQMLLESQASTLDQLCQGLPQFLRNSGDVLLIRAACAGSVGQADVARSLWRQAQVSDVPSTAYVRAMTAVVLSDDAEAKAAAVDRAWEVYSRHPPEGSQPHALHLLGWVELRLRRDPAVAIERLTAALQGAQASGLDRLARSVRSNLGFALTYAGRFTEAEATLHGGDPNNATRSAPQGWESFDGGLHGFARSYADFWRGDLERALDGFAEVVDEMSAPESFLPLSRVFFALTAVALEREQAYARAEYQLSLVPNEPRHGVPWESYKRVAAAWLQHARGRDDVRSLADPLLDRDCLPGTHVLLAELYRRMGDPGAARRALARIDRRQRTDYVHAMMLMTTALMELEAGREDRAHQFLERALDVAEPERLVYPFLIPGAETQEFLEEHVRFAPQHDRFLAHICQVREQMWSSGISLLTPREQELLQFLRTSMTSQEIADELHVSLNTVKTHLRSIYRKLGVSNRREAVKAHQ